MIGSASAQSRVIYRVNANSNCAITGFARDGRFAWTNVAGPSRFTISWSFSVTGAPEIVAYGPVTGIVMTSSWPRPTTPRPSASTACMIPAGTFRMGNCDPALSRPTEQPVHDVQVSAFYMDRTEVTKDQWDAVRNWALTNGYTDLGEGLATYTNHPVQQVSWYDCAKWCNARSEKDRLVPAYYTGTGLTNVYRTGTSDLDATNVNWSANGYRLPTEAEWEKAARGGLDANHYPWPSTNAAYASDFTNTDANFYVSLDPFEGGGPSDPQTTPAGYYNGSQVINGITQGANMTNGYSLYDMAGNVREWCWDRYDASYFSTYATNAWPANPTGPASGTDRTVRGGSWQQSSAGAFRCAYRNSALVAGDGNTGFRCVRGL